jgi:serine protease Do
LEKSFYEKILFSGSLNHGMSGGPVISRDGEVVGISVSSLGEQVSFLVPVKYLKKLLDCISNAGVDAPVDLNKRIEQQLIENQDAYMSRLMAAEWPLDSLGATRVPRILSETLDWWADTETDKEALYEHTYATCFSKDNIFLSSSFSTGKVLYRCDWYVSKGLNAPRFYNLLEKEFEDEFDLNPAGKDDVSNFESCTDFVTIAGKDWLVTFCSRNYKKYPQLYDVVVKMASVTKSDRALLIDLALSGVTQDAGSAFIKKFMEAIRWQD